MDSETSVGNLLALHDVLLRAPEPLALGGEAFVSWCRELLGTCLQNCPTAGVGGLLVPQIGQHAGAAIPFIAQPFNSDAGACVDRIAFEQALENFWTSIHLLPVVTSTQCAHPEPHLRAVIAPIASGFDRPIGYFWAVVEIPDAVTILAILDYAVMFVALAVRSQKTAGALQHLSKAVWAEATATKHAASEVARTCLSALSCSAVVVWEVNHRLGTLETLASAGNAGASLRVDMALGRGMAGVCALDNQPVIVDDLLDASELSQRNVQAIEHPDVVLRRGWRSAIFIPLDIGGQVAGVLAAYGRRPRAFSDLDKHIALAFAQRLCAGYVHAKRLEILSEMEQRLSIEAGAIEAGIMAMERVHDVDNSLSLAQSRISDITGRFRREREHPINQAASAAAVHIDHAHKTVKTLVRRARYNRLTPTPTLLHELIKEAVEQVRLQADTIGVHIYREVPEDLAVRVDRDQMLRVFLNFLDNSLFFLETDRKAGQRKIEISVTSEAPLVLLHFLDNGPGIAPHETDKVFDYFYTSKGDRGMGFGLAIAKRIVEAHHGTIRVRSDWGYDAEFIVSLPLTT